MYEDDTHIYMSKETSINGEGIKKYPINFLNALIKGEPLCLNILNPLVNFYVSHL